MSKLWWVLSFTLWGFITAFYFSRKTAHWKTTIFSHEAPSFSFKTHGYLSALYWHLPSAITVYSTAASLQQQITWPCIPFLEISAYMIGSAQQESIWQINSEKKVKLAHTRLQSVGFRSWSRFLAVSLQVMWVINPAVGYNYSGLQLPSQPLRGLLPILLLGEQRHNGCEQFA